MTILGLNESDIYSRKAKVLFEVCPKCSQYRNGRKLYSYPVQVNCIKSQRDKSNDHELLKARANSSARKVKSNPELANCWAEYQTFMKHLT